jgi:hypothetical protein
MRELVEPLGVTCVNPAEVRFSAAIAYDSCASFARMHGDSPGSSPWHTQVLLAPVLSLAYLGMSRWKRFGTVLAAATSVIWGWVLIATWTVKLFPMYFGRGRVSDAPARYRELVPARFGGP